MSRGNFIKKSYKAILYWAVFAIVAITLIALSATSLAKYVVSESADGGSANVLGVGVEELELVTDWQMRPGTGGDPDPGKDPDDPDIGSGSGNQAAINYDASKIIPGVDIVAPRIKLKINSSVNYSLYIKVSVPKFDFVNFGGTEGDISKTTTLVYKMTDKWVEEESLRITTTEYTVYTYKYNLGEGFVFEAGESYSYEDEEAIRILNDDTIFVSQYFKGKDIEGFKLSFEAYVRQVN